ncbi:hypothetical protein PUNSTDRAFT_130609 [Punctularia strigosozonata HHB-11173 SS5]|uniref:uncharacterized protein n=1 Tax=Punctularia strigosozonata (strain HHB-11173) TaxID=741275 RepID=UPI0004418191|nr:uncharacterized protein PUNSTDRAFT_130609 [Punctularia strigosozonata HHB-11173 SS5]EIN12356.1 hypothetical protein PUNSTDRAFT_130609 [Punctularia strigosozonata HHB-11173 SS5]
MARALADFTAKTYSARLLAFHAFSSSGIIQAFLALLAGLYAGTTLTNYFYGVQAWHLIHGLNWDMVEATTQTMLRATKRLTLHSLQRKKRAPVTEDIIRKVWQRLELEQGMHTAIFVCLTVAFYACTRLGELTVPALNRFNPALHVQVSNLREATDQNGLMQQMLHVPRTKTTPNGE